uniref:Uncharacterized protein n=1 Tax=Oryza sativa subsp. japonica TaxID=39947 RepID=Q6ZC57_ORYSJ|nr:hypothetical protein [Oryza sativa Japonica Group]
MAVVLVVAAPGGDPGGGIRSPHVAAQRPSSIRSAPPRCGAARHGQTLGGGGGGRRRRGIPLPTRAQGGPVPWIAATRIRDRECVADLEASTAAAARRRRRRDRDRGGRREEARREGISLSSLSVSRESRRREGDAPGGGGGGVVRVGLDQTGPDESCWAGSQRWCGAKRVSCCGCGCRRGHGDRTTCAGVIH